MFKFKPNLNAIIANVNTTIAQLGKLVTINSDQVDQNNEFIAATQLENSDLIAESARAARIAAKLSELVR